MEKELLDDLREIEKYCKDENIKIYPTSVTDIDLLDLNLIEFERDNWKEFLEIAKTLEVKILVIASETNDFEVDEDVNVYMKNLDEDTRQEYKRALKIVLNKTGQLVNFQVNFFIGNINYQYREEASWIDSYHMANDAFDLDVDDPEENYSSLSDTEIEHAARQVTMNPKYRNAKDRFERHRIADTLSELKDIEQFRDRSCIVRKAETIFEEEIQPVIEAELAQKIQALKKGGLKKIEVKSQLRISETVLNRHWYNSN